MDPYHLFYPYVVGPIDDDSSISANPIEAAVDINLMTLITPNISPNEIMKTLILPISAHVYWKQMRGI